MKKKSAYTITEQQLFALVAAGDEIAYRQLFHAYNKSLFPFVVSIVKSEADAQEIIQDVFLKLWLQRNRLSEIKNPGGWLHTVAANAAFNHLQKIASYELMLSKYQSRHIQAEEQFWEMLDTRQNWEAVITQIRKMPLRRRQVLQLSKIEGLSRKEIAEKLDISENTVRNHLAEAMLFLKEILKEEMLLLVLLIQQTVFCNFF